MKRSILSAGTAVFAATAAVFAAMAPASAAPPPRYSYTSFAGATQVQALGVAVQSEATAQSHITGVASATRDAKIASAKAGTVLVAGAANTDTTATLNVPTGGVTLVAHARTAGVSLLGGLIKASAIETTATIDAADAGAPTTSMETEILGLTIQGKPYAGSIDPNTGITIPGVVSIVLNQQQTAANENSAAIFGAGLRVTLLGSRNGTSAGATVAINPISQIMQPSNNQIEPGYALQGTAYGSYVNATVGDEVQVETGRSARVNMPTMGTRGIVQSNATAKAQMNGVMNLGAIYSEQLGIRNDALSLAEESVSIANVNLFGGLITAKALSTNAKAAVTTEGDTVSGEVDGGMTFVNLTIAGRKIPVDVKPNTTIHVPRLGAVTINEQVKAVQDTGNVRYRGQRTIGLHIVLDTKRAGLPVGAEVEVAFSQAVVWR